MLGAICIRDHDRCYSPDTMSELPERETPRSEAQAVPRLTRLRLPATLQEKQLTWFSAMPQLQGFDTNAGRSLLFCFRVTR
jgi:hypothetical protein